MSKKIPFLQMFAALCQWQELAEAVEGWVIVAAAIDKASRSALVTLDGARGAGANLIRQAEEAVARCYGLASVKFQMAAPEPETPAEAPGTGGSFCACLRAPDPPGPSSAGGEHGTGDGRLRADGGHSAGGAAEGPGERAGGQTQGKRGGQALRQDDFRACHQEAAHPHRGAGAGHGHGGHRGRCLCRGQPGAEKAGRLGGGLRSDRLHRLHSGEQILPRRRGQAHRGRGQEGDAPPDPGPAEHGPVLRRHGAGAHVHHGGAQAYEDG